MLLLAPRPAAADEGGVSFWLPGQFSSFAAVPGEAGWSLPAVYYHTNAEAGGSRSFPLSGRVTAGLEARADLMFIAPTYVLGAPVAGGQASFTLTGVFGRMNVDINGTLTGPGGGVLTGSQSDSLTNVGDLYPMAQLKWNHGEHNFLAYTMAGVPVGSYEAGRLANLGTNHWSLDAGGGYTYLDPKKGHEFSAVLGFTYNWKNKDTDYQNGVDAHLDWAASQFVSEQLHVGVAGYFYMQLSGDSGSGAVLGDFKSQVSGIGPQVGYFFPVAGKKWYVNFRGYYEFDAKNRPEGWNTWLTLAIPLGA
ncbi:transporter [Variovorax sp. LARHSF232]